jgi:hypothetical protein
LNKNIEDYIFLKENFLEDDFCDHTIDILSKVSWKLKSLEVAGVALEDLQKESELLDFNMLSNKILQPEIDKIEVEMMKKIPDVLVEYLSYLNFDWFRGWTGYSGIKFNRYSLGQGMMKHWDNVNSVLEGEVTGVPFLSLIGFLNNDYEGADLIICEDKKIDTNKGNLLIFPSSFMYPHKVTPLIKGTRYSFVSWVY